MIKKNSYIFDSFRDTEHEAHLLEIRANRDIETLIPTLKNSGLKKDMRVLDLGAGTGRRSEVIAQFVRGGEVVGIDQSEELLVKAVGRKEKNNLKNLFFKKADLMSLESLESLGKFDFVYVRLVIQHLKEPLKALENVGKIVEPGGVIFLEDTDRDWVSVIPEISEWEKMYEKIKDAQSERGGDPRSGRKLGYYLAKSGFKNVKVRLLPVAGDNPEIIKWLDYYVPSYLNHLDKTSAAEATEILEGIRKRCETEPMFFYQAWFQASGVKG